jgi:hypothetical protein
MFNSNYLNEVFGGSKEMKITRKLFINRRNNQGSVTLPKKVLDELQKASDNEKLPKKIFLEISLREGVKK